MHDAVPVALVFAAIGRRGFVITTTLALFLVGGVGRQVGR